MTFTANAQEPCACTNIVNRAGKPRCPVLRRCRSWEPPHDYLMPVSARDAGRAHRGATRRRRKEQPGKDIGSAGSATLVRPLLRDRR